MSYPRTDGLTGLANSLLVEEVVPVQLADARTRGWQVGVASLDVDGLKRINDRFGHLDGDDVLRAVARILVTLSDPASLVSRFGCDEFLLILSEPTGLASRAQAEHVVRGIPHEVAAAVGHWVTVTVGIAMFPHDGVNLHDLLLAADRRLYSGKAAGGNCVVS